ncbi:MAG: hypothetical protein INH43_24385 [Acidobacteriaceae bacterium]|nr:hypothetical protein [Acidobacteriaceae bacterium]
MAGQVELVTVVGVKAGQLKGQSSYLDSYRTSYRRFLLFGPIRAEPQESFLSRDLLKRGFPL